MNGYDLSRKWFDFSFENPDIIKPTHTAIYFFAIERCNRLGWKEKFGLPTDMAMEALGIKSYNTYANALAKIVELGFIIMIEKSKNQWTSKIIALSYFNKALVKQQQSTRQSIGKSIDSIYKQVNNKQLNKETIEQIDLEPKQFFGFIENNLHLIFEKEKKEDFTSKKEKFKKEVFRNEKYENKILEKFYNHWSESNLGEEKMRYEFEKVFDIKTRLEKWRDFNWENKNKDKKVINFGINR